jgi:hypothetical protein
MKKIVLVLLLSGVSLIASNVLPVNKTQLCSIYEDSFYASADVWEDAGSCMDLKYSILSFKQMLLVECPIEPDMVTIIYYLDKQYKKECE